MADQREEFDRGQHDPTAVATGRRKIVTPATITSVAVDEKSVGLQA
jgi:hypothetical protein